MKGTRRCEPTGEAVPRQLQPEEGQHGSDPRIACRVRISSPASIVEREIIDRIPSIPHMPQFSQSHTTRLDECPFKPHHVGK
jgi:hypothetical protein